MLPEITHDQITMSVRLTQFSHGAGCGCKIAPALLEQIVRSELSLPDDQRLLVGNDSNDDAAVYDLGDGRAVVSTTDFFMPIVDDPLDFGRIAATNAMSDVFAMGGQPLMAIAILGWPLDKLDATIARQVVDGGRQACADAGFLLAGGHSIDSPEPIFGTAVTGIVNVDRLKRNDTATADCDLFLTKPLGIGILTTAEKQQKLAPEHRHLARDAMCASNHFGTELSAIKGVSAMTDVTGFGLAGHLMEICRGSGVRAQLEYRNIPVLDGVDDYVAQGCVPGGTERNYASYGDHLSAHDRQQRALLCDPQTSGGLLVAVNADGVDELRRLAQASGQLLVHIGKTLAAKGGPTILINS